jgi:hypothetical protein
VLAAFGIDAVNNGLADVVGVDVEAARFCGHVCYWRKIRDRHSRAGGNL